MALFNKLKTVGKTLGKTAEGIADTISSNMAEANSLAVEKVKISKLESEKKGLDNEINLAYTQIGRKFVQVAIETNEISDIGVADILQMLDPKLSRKKEIEKEIIEIEKKIKDQQIIQEKSKINQEYEIEKEKLEKAYNMGIITKNEYDEKLNFISKKINNFEEIRRIEKQYEMGIISLIEKEAKIKELIS
ncbi:MAG: hypothetical protein ACRC8F_05285 [Cetobacterium sp.]|uniref:hypothetical protein n=1 Tax=Cetobacterium sp. TaxID=2071632 RepID=UPI003EE6944D